MDSMTDKELDSKTVKIFQEEGRTKRIAMGSGRPHREVLILLQEYAMGQMWGKMKGLKLPGKGGSLSAMSNKQ